VSETIAVFGGSFNPPHVAHVLAVSFVLATADVDRVLVVPTFQHPFAKALASYEDRVHMCTLAMGWLPRVEISRVEEELGGDSLTLRTLEHLHAKLPDARLRLVMGADLMLESSKWFRFDDVCKLAPPLVLGRASVTGVDAPRALLPNVSSTEVRALFARGAWSELEPLVPREVLAYAKAKGLYAA
jgi:nicotinate-nucleotide adenylyltransferase